MKTEIIIITQKHVGTALVKAAKNIFGKLPLPVIAVSVNYRTKPEALLHKLCRVIQKTEEHTSLLILTDLYGSTPSNIATKLCDICQRPTRLVAGLNLPMLIKVLNYANLPAQQLAEKAIAGGKQGVLDYQFKHSAI